MSKLAATDSHERRPFKPQIYKGRGRVGLMVKEDIRSGQMIETGVMVQTAIQGKTIGVIDLEEILEEIADRVVEKVIEMKGIVTTTIEIGTDQGREPLQETIEGIEVLAMIGLDQGLELIQIGIG